jgi:nucleotide-binding universal stress UspA family protein
MTPRTLTSIFHPSDFSPGDEPAFLHAVKLALLARADLDILHANPDAKEIDWDDFPSVRQALQRWGLIAPGSSKEDVRQLGLNVHKVKRSSNDPLETILAYLKDHEPDLVVLATHQRSGLSRWMNRSIAEPIARHAGIITLFVPRRVVGFVSIESGTPQLEQILVPIDRTPDPQNAVDAAATLARTLACPRIHFTLLHVGLPETLPHLEIPIEKGWSSETRTVSGNVVDQILNASEESNADLIAMATLGRDGFMDALRGSTTEQVLRATRCPVLAIPANSINE